MAFQLLVQSQIQEHVQDVPLEKLGVGGLMLLEKVVLEESLFLVVKGVLY